MKKFSKKRWAFVLKLTIVLGSGSMLASCGNAQNKNGQAALVAALQQKLAASQGKVNPTTGQPATASATGTTNLLSGANGTIWASDCYRNSSFGNDSGGNSINSYAEVYMFYGTAWFAEFGFYEDSGCNGTPVQPTTWTNNFGAGYIANMPNVSGPGSGTLSLVAWDSSNAIGGSIGISTVNGLSPTGGSITLPFNLATIPSQQAPDANETSTMNYGSLYVGDIALNANPASATMQLQVYSANSPE